MSEVLPLRPFRESELPVLDRMLNDPEVLGQYAWTGWSGNTTALRQRWERDRLLSPDVSMLALVRQDAAVGAMTWRPVAYNGVSQCWNVGVFVLPEERGRGVMAGASRAVVDYLFAHTQAHRIEAHVEAGNIAARRCAERAGMVHEGTARGAAWRGGGWRDLDVLAVLRSDLPPPAADD
ncbi:GNAT family N-acetyltransferase [Streptomyces sp. NPDC001339]|uniref:GNAT family N-acetyltransferase n=1 Tax=Streptomyces sp. NPDC001339 TaxID=3364563 RepID=UPI0036CCC699